MENRYREGLRNICKDVRAAERLLGAKADAEEDEEYAESMRIMARVYKVVASWVIDEIRDADDEVRNGDNGND